MKLIGAHLSPYVRKVATILTIKGISYEPEVVIPGMMPDDFIEISPLLKIPVLVDGEVTLPDSSVICEYLNEKYPEPATMPSDVAERARARFLEEYGDTRLLEYMSVPFIENVVKPGLRNEQPDEDRVRRVVHEMLPGALDYLESQVPAQGFLFGDFSTADIALVSPTINAGLGGYTVDAGRWPRYAGFVERVKAFPPVVAVLQAEQEAMGSLLG
ncbi:glutathione S-transferase family protein [Pseudohalioglobus sediminis]|uniref:Glutathione S-transferase family protein n=1 Tax=Pseudohalioglobus sediminis TaxID=2606449 RepID=A0A5B0X3R4_9GAMM|nr:glutathione S-transferase family protein [Pseudohalioglobus sediminis]KAA1193248.1 glutathione S-transferase family protein [Pseudohalioglobus sediminis]